MKRFLREIAIFLGLQLAIAGLFALAVRHDPNHFQMAIVDKHARLADHSHGPRLVFVGGSNLAFGLDSEQIGQQLPFQPINMALQASLGLEFMLAEVRNGLVAGDVVVLSPEYNLLDGQMHAKTRLQLFENHPAATRYLVTSWRRLFDQEAFAYAGQFARQGGHGWTQFSGDFFTKKPYTRDSFNRFGDVVAHCDLPPKKDLSNRPLFQEGYSHAGTARSIALLNEFWSDCQRRGVRVFLSFPPVPVKQLEESRETIVRIERQLRDELKIPIIDSPQQMAQPLEDFYDTVYHLTGTGRAKRTRKLVDNLSPHLPTVIAIETTNPMLRR